MTPIYDLYTEKKYRKQLKLMGKRGYDLDLVDIVVTKLRCGQVLPAKYADHPLWGNRKGYRCCHIQGDWVLIYRIDKGVLTLILAETGTHSDILET